MIRLCSFKKKKVGGGFARIHEPCECLENASLVAKIICCEQLKCNSNLKKKTAKNPTKKQTRDEMPCLFSNSPMPSCSFSIFHVICNKEESIDTAVLWIKPLYTYCKASLVFQFCLHAYSQLPSSTTVATKGKSWVCNWIRVNFVLHVC